MRLSLAIFERDFGHDDPQVAIIAGNLATLLVRCERPDSVEAEALAHRALMIDYGHGANPVPLIRDYMNLSEVLAAGNKFREAVEAGSRGWELSSALFGESHSQTIYMLQRLEALRESAAYENNG